MVRTPSNFTTAMMLGWVGLGIAALGLMVWQSNDRLSSLIAAVIFALCLLNTRYHLNYDILSAPFLYLASLGAFHLGLVVPWALGLYDPWEIWWFHLADLHSSLVLVVVAFVCAQLALILAGRWDPKPSPSAVDSSRLLMEDRTVFLAGISILIVGGGAYFTGASEVFGGGLSSFVYTDMFRLVQEKDSRWLGIGILLIPIGIYISASGATKKQLNFILAFFSVWVIWQFFLGSRSGGLIPALVMLYICMKKNYRVARRVTILFFVILLYLIPAISAVRLLTARDRFDFDHVRAAHPLSAIVEMGGSIETLAETYRLIGPQDMRHGKTYVEAMKRVLPNISSGQQAGRSLHSLDYDNSPALWFVVVAEPWLLKDNLGRGFSSIAEAYMNFGAGGVAAIFFVLGLLLAGLERMAIRNAYSLSGQCVILAPLLWTVRNDFSVFTRSAVWGCAYIIFVWLVAQFHVRIRDRGALASPNRNTPMQPSFRALVTKGK